MHASNLSRFLAIFLVAGLAACSSTPTEETTGEEMTGETTAPAETAPATPVERAEPVQPEVTRIPVTADNFYNHPSNYGGNTDTRTIYFAFDNSTVPSAAFETLRAHAAYLKSNSTARVRLEGHADERGTREYNVALGERRAQSVEKFLRVQGVPAAQIEVVSYGEEKRAAYGSDEMAHAKNRRVVLTYLSGRP